MNYPWLIRMAMSSKDPEMALRKLVADLLAQGKAKHRILTELFAYYRDPRQSSDKSIILRAMTELSAHVRQYGVEGAEPFQSRFETALEGDDPYSALMAIATELREIGSELASVLLELAIFRDKIQADERLDDIIMEVIADQMGW